MLVYLSVFTTALGLLCIGNRRNIPVAVWMSLGLLIVFSGLRYGVGIDFPAYWDLYRGNEYSQSEAGFRLLCGIFTRLGFGPQAMFLATSAIVVVFVYKAAVYYDKTHVCFAFFVFLFAGTFLESLNLVRQYVAIALFFWGSRYIVGRSPTKFLLVVLAASLFHM